LINILFWFIVFILGSIVLLVEAVYVAFILKKVATNVNNITVALTKWRDVVLGERTERE